MEPFSWSEFYERHPYIFKYMALALFSFVFSVGRSCVAYQSEDPHYPYLHLEEQVEDTGVYLSPDDSLFGEEGEMNSCGKHLVLVTSLELMKEEDGRYWYGPARDFKDVRRKYYLFSTEKVDEINLDTYVEVDGMIWGYLNEPTGNHGGLVAHRRPVLQICAIRRGDLLELAAPLVHEERPELSVSDAGVTISLDALTYRSELTAVQFTLTNDSERYVRVQNMKVTFGNGDVEDSNYRASDLSRYYGGYPSDKLPSLDFPGIFDPGDSLTTVCLLKPVGYHEDLVFTFELRTTDGVIRDGEVEWETRELTVTYTPSQDADATQG